MFSTIFRKQFILYMGTLIISFVFLGAVLTRVYRNYTIDQRVSFMMESGQKISDAFNRNYMYGVIDVNLNQLTTEIRILNQYMNASLIIVDPDLYVKTVTSDVSDYYHTTLELPAIEPVFDGEPVVLQGTLGGIYPNTMLTVVYPVSIGEEIIYSVIMSSSMSELEQSVSDIYRLTLICLVIAGAVGFALIFLFSSKVSKPLKQMSEAARIIEEGDFDKRIEYKSRDEAGQLAESFNNMAESLARQEKMRSEFITNISHDLRSPLTSMIGFLQAIADGTIPPERQEHYIRIVLDESERLSKLANDILELNKSQALSLSLDVSDFDLNTLIRETLTMFEKRCTDKNINIHLSLADKQNIIKADREKIQRCLYNLMDNAVKFTPDGGNIAIETTVRDAKVIISVADTGIGINQEDQKRIFERFYKADISRGEDKTGSGLGLSIVKEFIRVHGETITVESELGKGCKFIFAMPLA